MEDQSGIQTHFQDDPLKNVFIAPSIHDETILAGESYTHHSALPSAVTNEPSTPCVLGVDEAGRGPVLGPMVYGLLYLPLPIHHSLLAETHHFDDSKTLTTSIRSSLMEKLCSSSSDLYANCGWATRVMSARDISVGMLKPAGEGMYNLNAQAMDATIQLIKDVFARGVNVQEIYIDTIGKEATYQKKLERIFPTTKITVAKKADSKYPCVSAASVCAKVTRDAALQVCYRAYSAGEMSSPEGWGSGYPSDSKSVTWLKKNLDPVFGWGPECRFSWGTVKDMLDGKEKGVQVEWPEVHDDECGMKVSSYFSVTNDDEEQDGEANELANWFGRPAPQAAF